MSGDPTQSRDSAPPSGPIVSPEPTGMPDPAELERLQALALHVATQVALLIGARREVAVAATKSSPTDVVTETDRQAEELAASLVRAARPDDGFFGEEGGHTGGASGITWVVDPIDGTVNYVYDIPAYAVSVAAVSGDPGTSGAWRPVAGAVVNPVSGERFWAHTGGGAWRQRGRLDPQRIRASAQADLGQCLVGTGFSYDADTRAQQARVLAHLLPRVRDIRRFGSAALDLCHVADGTLDGYYERGLNPWDIAAGWVIATEAGAHLSGAAGGAPDPQMTLAAGACHRDLAAVVAAADGHTGS